MSLRYLFLLAVCLTAFLFPQDLSAQTFSYRSFDNSNGLPGNYVNAISQDKNGLLWVGLETGIYRHDGFDFYNIPINDSLSTGYPSALFCDDSGVMWIGCNDGLLFVSDNNKPLKRVNGIAADRINKIRSDSDGNIWVVSQSSGLFMFKKGNYNSFENLQAPEGVIILDVLFLNNGNIFIAAQDNLYLCSLSGDKIKIHSTFPELEYVWVNCLETLSEDTYVAGTDGSGLFIIEKNNENYSVVNLTGTLNLDNTRIKEILSEDPHTIYVATRESGLVKAVLSDDLSSVTSETAYNIASGLLENDVKTIFRDREENLWIGLFNNGLEAVTTNAFSFFQPQGNKEIRFIGNIGSSVVMGNRSETFEFDNEKGEFNSRYNLTSKIRGATITAWHICADGSQWIGTDGEGVFRTGADGIVKSFFKSANPGQNIINRIDADNSIIWLATMDGLLAVDKLSAKCVRTFTTSDMLTHNKILDVAVAGEGVVAVGTEGEMLCFADLKRDTVYKDRNVMNGYMKNIVQAISFSSNDNSIIAGTLGNGVFMIRGDSLFNVTAQDGLLSNYVYSVLYASDGRIWAGHEKGFSIWDPHAGTIRTFSRDFGVTGECLPYALFESPSGTIYVGTTEGLIVYNPQMERITPEAPRSNIMAVIINGLEYPFSDTYILPYRRVNTIEVKYAGVNLHDPLNVSYRTMLENYDEDMGQPTGDRSVTYKLGDGHYRFVLESSAKNNPGLISNASFELVIKKPFYRSWWFTLSVILLAAIVVFIIIKLRDRAHRKLNDFLEEELSKRTREVHEQKEELMQKNLDITESIKYAKRIQSSVLPDIGRLNSVFSEAFVFFAPRDIVSGDFYWFDWVDRDKFIVVCADSTGHGVPGAFMSMIGTALLQDIITRKGITKPSAILKELDRQIFSTLNQNQEVEAANDGMDIVVCEFNVKERHLTFASAMRPVILIIGGEQQYVRGNRSSIGGDSASEKFYDDQEYYLKEGDIVYLFSDGYPDQFGGKGNKKMKISRLRSLIDEIKDHPLDVQKSRVKDFFYEWKSDFDQVDDVLIMGIRV